MELKDVLKRIKRAESKHNTNEAKRKRDAKKHGYEFNPRVFSLCLPWRPRLQVFKSSSGKNEFAPLRFQGYSYQWWVYVAKFRGIVVFNDYNYSRTTCNHQGDMRRLLSELGIRVDVYVSTSASLDSMTSLIEAVRNKYIEMFDAEIAIRRRGSKQESNRYRRKLIADCQRDIRKLAKAGVTLSKADVAAIRSARLEVERTRLVDLAKERETKAQLRREATELLNNSFVTDAA